MKSQSVLKIECQAPASLPDYFERGEHAESWRADPVGTAVLAKKLANDPNPPHGEKGAFRKITFTVPPDIYERLMVESTSRKIAGRRNHLISCVLREALTKYLACLDQ
jgi:hypothetical protein